MKKSMILLGMLSIGYAYAQEERVGINTETPSATLNVKTKTDATSPKNLELPTHGNIFFYAEKFSYDKCFTWNIFNAV